MSKILVGGSSGGIMSDDVTATLADVAKGKTAVTSDSGDEVVTGTLELTGNAETGDVLSGVTFYNNNLYTKRTGTLTLTGNATAAYVLSGYTFYNTNAKSKITGTMTVNSLLSFSVAVISGRRVTATWQNPIQAAGRPYSGVYIKYSTNGYPGTGGTPIYKGVGSNAASGGISTATFDLPNVGTRYYLSIYPYVTTSAGELLGGVLNAQVTTGGEISYTYTSSTIVTVPQGYTQADIFCVGGGGKGEEGINDAPDFYGGGGGGSGYTKTVKNVAVSVGQSLAIVIGAGSSKRGTNGSESSVTRSGAILCSAKGGESPESTLTRYRAGDGGSGGGTGGSDDRDAPERWAGGVGGSNGGNGGVGVDNGSEGIGQGMTTRAFEEPSGTLYAGGGGGGGGGRYGHSGGGGAGGSGGGGAGGNGRYTGGANGSANTGGGGGGDGGGPTGESGGNGGSGIVLIRFH